MGDRGQDQDRLHLGEDVADALTRAATEGIVGEPRQPAGEVSLPSVGPERVGLVEPSRVAMHRPRGRDDHIAAGQRVAVEYWAVLQNSPAVPEILKWPL